MGTGELLGKPNKLWGVTCDGLASRPGGVQILLAASCYGNLDKLRPDAPVLAPRLHFLFFLFVCFFPSFFLSSHLNLTSLGSFLYTCSMNPCPFSSG